MTGEGRDLWIYSLRDAFKTGFESVISADRRRRTPDIAAAWASLVAGGLDDVRITAAPIIDAHQPLLPLIAEHRIKTEHFDVLRAGLGGGPTVDILLQLQFDTEEMEAGWGIPLVFRYLENTGRLTDLDWYQLRDDCRQLVKTTPCARVVFVADNGCFDWFSGHSSWSKHTLLASDAAAIAGSKVPPKPLPGREIEAFCLDLASGWIGDPALSGLGDDRLVLDFMTTCHVRQVLRLHIRHVNPGEIFAPVPLPF